MYCFIGLLRVLQVFDDNKKQSYLKLAEFIYLELKMRFGNNFTAYKHKQILYVDCKKILFLQFMNMDVSSQLFAAAKKLWKLVAFQVINFCCTEMRKLLINQKRGLCQDLQHHRVLSISLGILFYLWV